ncbi:DEAD/DEAH box helicase family protein, partial [bacterium]|nr:DEAD/DEAH box helicase family protein [bacterium]
TYKAFERFLRKKDYRKAYRCLEKIHNEFPNDIELMQEIVQFCLGSWRKPEIGRKWLIKLTKSRSVWLDHMFLSQAETELGNIGRAKECLKKARELQKSQPGLRPEKEARKVFSELEEFIRYAEAKALARAAVPDIGPSAPQLVKRESRPKKQKAERAEQARWSEPKSRPEIKSPPAEVQIPLHRIPLKTEPVNEETFSLFLKRDTSTLKECQLLIDYTHLTIQSGFDDLLCLNAITDVEKYWYQIETVKKVLKYFHGRVLLSDEVGLGKTIEAGMLVKEYLMRGMIKNVLILTPASLVSQWKEEMRTKFGIEFMTTDDPEFMRDSINFWNNRFIIASINTTKSSKNMPVVVEKFYDLVIIDEAHHLRNRTTLAWKLVNQIKKRFIFLLTATPVQNNLIELFNLITLLKPGQFKTEKLFRKEYIQRGNLKAPANKERLAGLLRDVMIRNTRSAIDLKLPKRFATTIRVEPTETEKQIYLRISDFLRNQNFKKPMINLFLREAGSSPFALKNTLLNKDGTKDIIDAIDSLEDICKGNELLKILLKNPAEKKVVFTQYLKSVDYVTDLLQKHGISFVTFRGDMPLRKKDEAIARFREEIPVLVSTESGGEGKNMQFCNTIINFDLPWNPMRIEQRIGRLHRIGQTRDVFIFNLSVKGTIEDYIIDILANKIGMFEMVIGEIEPILGHIGEDKEFEDIILEIWSNSSDTEKLKDGFEQLGNELLNAKREYLKTKALDEEIFGEDYEV